MKPRHTYRGVVLRNAPPARLRAQAVAATPATARVRVGREVAGRRPASSAELAELLLDEVDVAVVPGEAFGTPGYFRLSCALGDSDLEEGITRLGKLLGQAR